MEKDINILRTINDYYNSEMAAHNKYLNYASYLDSKNISIYAKFLTNLAKDKTDAHMTRTFKFLSYFGFPANITERCAVKALDYEKLDQMSLTDAALTIFKDVLKTELALRKEIGVISVDALTNKDVETFNFTQWFVDDALKDISEVEEVIFAIENTNLLLSQRNIGMN